MRLSALLAACCVVLLLVSPPAFAQASAGRIEFSVSMAHPASHYFHVAMRCEGLTAAAQDFKLPEWTPGYYRIMDYARNLVNFRAEDGAGSPLAWEKTAKNTWRVRTGGAAAITVSYDIYAFARSVADSYLDDEKGFIAPASALMYVSGQILHPVDVTIVPPNGWSRVSTGLDPVPGHANTFTAPDFDVLYDCPIYIGNQEILSFEVQGIPHTIAAENLGHADRAAFVADLKRMVESAVAVIGEIPYRHYTFIVMGAGGGGLEHLNSTAVFSDAAGLSTPAGRQRWLSFICHEFFHLYNVKRIRPIALGPFDYDRENYTRMLWVSEGITVYYEDLILVRAGLITREDWFERLRASIRNYENIPGHLVQSVTDASFDTWIQFFSRGEHAANTTISYYDKGAALGLLLDLAIRHGSQNRSSLDAVMRTLYQEFYKGKKRGFTDQEFREVCERAAGVPLPEIFDEYAPTVKAIDYAKYSAYAGLEIDTALLEMPGVAFGAATQDQNGAPVVTTVESGSPASRAGISAQDEILAIDGLRVTARSIVEVLAAKKPGDTARVLVARRGAVREIPVVLGPKTERSFRIKPAATPSPLQAAILKAMTSDQR